MSAVRLALFLAIAIVAGLSLVGTMGERASAGSDSFGDANCNGLFNESDLLPALEELAGIGEGSPCPENVNVICEDPYDFRDVLVLLNWLADLDPAVDACIATPTPGPTGTTPKPTTASPTDTGGATATPPPTAATTPASTETFAPSPTPTETPTATQTPTATPTSTSPATPTATLDTDEADLEAVTIAPVNLQPTPVSLLNGTIMTVDFDATLDNSGPASADNAGVSLAAQQISGNPNVTVYFQWQAESGDFCLLFMSPATCGGPNLVDEVTFHVDLPVNSPQVVSRDLKFRCEGAGPFEVRVAVHVFHPTSNDPDTNNQEKTFTFSGNCHF